MANRFRFQRLELKLGWSTGATAGPHAWPLTFSRWSLFFAAFTTRIVDTGTKNAWKCYSRTAASITARASHGWVKTSLAIGAHSSSCTPIVCSATTAATCTTITTVVLAFYWKRKKNNMVEIRLSMTSYLPFIEIY